MKKDFEVKPVKSIPYYGKVKSTLTLPLIIGAAGIMAGCLQPVVGVPYVEFSVKEIKTVDSTPVSIPGLQISLASPTDHSDFWVSGRTDENGLITIQAQKQQLPLDIIIEDIDGVVNGSFDTKIVPFDDEETETIIMEEKP